MCLASGAAAPTSAVFLSTGGETARIPVYPASTVVMNGEAKNQGVRSLAISRMAGEKRGGDDVKYLLAAATRPQQTS